MDEIELKLQLTAVSARTIGTSGVLPGKPKPVAQQSIYFDTPDRALAAANLSLRIREAKGKRIQTVKQADKGAAGIFARPEWERPVRDDVPVLDDDTPVPAAL